MFHYSSQKELSQCVSIYNFGVWITLGRVKMPREAKGVREVRMGGGCSRGDLFFISPDTTHLAAVVLAIRKLNDLNQKRLKIITK